VSIKINKEYNDLNKSNAEKVTRIGKWEFVPISEQFENKYKAVESEDSNNEG
jgi:hypothetical protein